MVAHGQLLRKPHVAVHHVCVLAAHVSVLRPSLFQVDVENSLGEVSCKCTLTWSVERWCRQACGWSCSRSSGCPRGPSSLGSQKPRAREGHLRAAGCPWGISLVPYLTLQAVANGFRGILRAAGPEECRPAGQLEVVSRWSTTGSRSYD